MAPPLYQHTKSDRGNRREVRRQRRRAAGVGGRPRRSVAQAQELDRLPYLGIRRSVIRAAEQRRARSALLLVRRQHGVVAHAAERSEERRVGKGCVSTCRSRRSPDRSKKKKQIA